jgi:hypothetical protein
MSGRSREVERGVKSISGSGRMLRAVLLSVIHDSLPTHASRVNQQPGTASPLGLHSSPKSSTVECNMNHAEPIPSLQPSGNANTGCFRPKWLAGPQYFPKRADPISAMTQEAAQSSSRDERIRLLILLLPPGPTAFGPDAPASNPYPDAAFSQITCSHLARNICHATGSLESGVRST